MSDPHDLRSPYPFRRRVLCPLGPDDIHRAVAYMAYHFGLDMTYESVSVYARAIRLCPCGVLSDESWCLRWCHQLDGNTSIVIEHPRFPFGVCPDASEVLQSFAPMP